jgi:zinc transport system substrate-binding protein
MKYEGLMGLRVILGVLVCFSAAAGEGKLRIVTTFLPAYCFTINVTGDRADVQNLTSGAGGLHDYQLTPAEMRKISSADVIVMNGLGLESWMDKALRSGTKTGVRLVRLSDGLKGELIPIKSERNREEINPHIWLDPKLAAHSLSNILSALSEADPGNAEAYAANVKEYVKRLERLEDELNRLLEPVRSISFVTYHDAFPYFARRFELKIAGVVEQTLEVTPAPKYLSALLGTIRETHAKALFTEPGGDNRLARRIASDAKIKLAELDPMEIGPANAKAYEETMLKDARIVAANLK